MLCLTFVRMSRTLNINLVVTAAIAVAGLLTVQAVQQRHNMEVSEHQFSERVNLALRHTAHRLLTIAGNRAGAIPPVQQTAGNTWLVRLEQNFSYDSLPMVLRETFLLHTIKDNYNVAVLACDDETLVLGYTASLLTTGTDIPCGGREQTAGCYNLRVTFTDRDISSPQETSWWAMCALLCFVALGYGAYRVFKTRNNKPLEKMLNDGPGVAAPSESTSSLRVGQSTLFVENQKLVTNGVAKDLTYRETKLLQLFCRNANQLLERDLILKSVWEDEGILVGRSVDVFVSRLRKLLKDDELVRIVNVHGVGYRLEVF